MKLLEIRMYFILIGLIFIHHNSSAQIKNTEIFIFKQLFKQKIDIEIPLEGNYLYAFPPYPIPAKNTVNILIYWDNKLDINNSEICVYDMIGIKILNKEKIVINRNNEISGIISFNVENFKKGVYFLKVNHGTANLLVKIIKE